jgi:beta-glucosidase
MSLEQKLGQMSQPDIGLITKSGKTNEDAITKYFLGSLLIGGDGCPDNNGDLQTDNVDYLKATKENWKKLGDRLMSRTVDVALDGGQTA